jgi:predicted glycosyltransferase
MPARSRILIYSHDSFGLGHIRRCRTIGHAIAEAYRGVEVLIVSGSPIIGSFDFKARVDFIRVPGLIKLRNGEYESLARHRPVGETTRLRAAMIGETALNYRPDVFIVDKEPLGLRGELEPTLAKLKDRGVKLVLGLRDILDAPDVLAEEWRRKRVFPAIEELYDAIWVYGLKTFYDPLQGLPLSASVARKTAFTGYLRRPDPTARLYDDHRLDDFAHRILVTPGGGGDGAQMVESVLRAYEAHGASMPPALFVFGPFMPAPQRAAFAHRIKSAPGCEAITFDSRIERRLAAAAGVVAMGGYNTFCEVLSFDKPALLMPRAIPRMEQTIRARRASELGLSAHIEMPQDDPAPMDQVMAVIRDLATQAPPSHARIPGLLDGTQAIVAQLKPWLSGLERTP